MFQGLKFTKKFIIISAIAIILTVAVVAFLILFFMNKNTPQQKQDNKISSEVTTLKYIALGDSITAGYTANTSYPEQLKQKIENTNNVIIDLRNFGTVGMTSSELLDALNNNPAFIDYVKNADIITWNIGGNDFLGAIRLFTAGKCGGKTNEDCIPVAIEKFKTNWQAIINRIKELKKTNAKMYTIDNYLPEYHLFTTINNNFLTYYQQINDYVYLTCGNEGIPVAKVSDQFNNIANELIGADNVHPNDKGQQLIADYVFALYK